MIRKALSGERGKGTKTLWWHSQQLIS
jgi:hypothetical protein